MAPIQIGLKGNTLRDFLDKSICRIEDCTPLVRKWNEQRKKGNQNKKKLDKTKNGAYEIAKFVLEELV